MFNLAGGSSIGKQLDGRADHHRDYGSLIAAGLNTRACDPVPQLALNANGGKTVGCTPTGLTANSTEAEVDGYLLSKAFHPRGSFDDTVDGNGDPQHHAALVRTDLAAPWGNEGTVARPNSFSNLLYTARLDPTHVASPGGRAFRHKFGGTAAGNDIADGWMQVLAATGPTGYPYIKAAPYPASASAASTRRSACAMTTSSRLI